MHEGQGGAGGTWAQQTSGGAPVFWLCENGCVGGEVCAWWGPFHWPGDLASACMPTGLEVKVAFGGVWKESLSELSGGQKSLLALSLILAMLLFKPAPIYILDEVDAALDLSHTQNIGHMIKTHFPQSQV